MNAAAFTQNAMVREAGPVAHCTRSARWGMTGRGVIAAGFLALQIAGFAAAPPSNIASWWRAENDALDSIGANSGAALNGLSFGAGEVGQAFLFTGANQRMKVPA